MEAARLQAIIEADTGKAEKSISDFGKKVEESGKKTGGFVGKVAGIAGKVGGVLALAGGVDFLTSQLGDMISQGEQANQVHAQTAAVLKSTHGAAGETADSVEQLSNKLMNLTGIDDDTVTSTQNMLLTFTNIGAKGGVFDQATKTALDMSTALGQDTKSSAIQLGKALNDPLTGITALQRVGVTFNQGQKDQIATMMKHGDIAGAQGVILKELNKEFGGSAEAAGKANGGVKILTAQYDNMKQTLGQALIPIMKQLAAVATNVLGHITDFISYLEKHEGAMTAFKIAVGVVATVIGVALVASFVSWAIAAGAAAIATIVATAPVLAIAAGVGLLIAGIVLLVTHWKELSTNFAQSDFGQGFIHFINTIIDGINAFIDLIDHIPGVNIPHIQHVGLADMGVHAGAVGTKSLATGQAADASRKGRAFASGGLTPGGPVLVGERGPELIAPPAGSRVFTADETRRMLAGGGTHTTVNIYPQKADMNADDLSRHLRRVALHASTGGAY